MKTYSRVYARIDLDAIHENVKQVKKRLSPGTKIMPVLKADGYGHGAVPIAHMLEESDDVWGFGVATPEEAFILKKEGITKPLLVLGCVFPDQYKDVLSHGVRMNIYTEEMANGICAVAKKENLTAYMHIKIDTGMTRLGFDCGKESEEAIARIAALPNVCLEGIFTHLARADEADQSHTEKQLHSFDRIIDDLMGMGISFPYRHCANSAAAIGIRKADYDMIRLGISLYGLYPSAEFVCKPSILTPALSLISHVSSVKKIMPGTQVGYGGTFVSEKPMTIATVPVGYADGYPRSLSNKGCVLIRGKRAGILGRICMDQFMVDVTDIKEVSFGDKVTLIGRDMDDEITVPYLEELSGRYRHELVCDLGKRIARVYVSGGNVIKQTDYF